MFWQKKTDVLLGDESTKSHGYLKDIHLNRKI